MGPNMSPFRHEAEFAVQLYTRNLESLCGPPASGAPMQHSSGSGSSGDGGGGQTQQLRALVDTLARYATCCATLRDNQAEGRKPWALRKLRLCSTLAEELGQPQHVSALDAQLAELARACAEAQPQLPTASDLLAAVYGRMNNLATILQQEVGPLSAAERQEVGAGAAAAAIALEALAPQCPKAQAWAAQLWMAVAQGAPTAMACSSAMHYAHAAHQRSLEAARS